MSDETPAERRDRFERLRREADEALANRDRIETAALLAEISAHAERQIAAFRELPCRGEVARIPECSDEFASKCERRTTPSCPRSIVELDAGRARDTLAERLELSGIPRGVRNVLALGFQPTEATQAVDAWLATDLRLLLLSGGVGTGKSVAAGYAIQRSPGRWMHASEIAKAGRFEAEARWRELTGCRLLVIDDLGSEFNDAGGWGRAKLTELVLERYEDAKRTVITTNLDGKQWATYADQRIRDRVKGNGMARVIGGKSKRHAEGR